MQDPQDPQDNVDPIEQERAERSSKFLKFAERGHLMRWFGERSNGELAALKRAFEKSRSTKSKA
jgi:hypothetical protein